MITFNKLFQYIAERDITPAQLGRMTGIDDSTISRLRHNQNVSMAFINTICLTLNCKVEDVMEYLEEN
jgi:DNA-binding Xre family transcriptional regulator